MHEAQGNVSSAVARRDADALRLREGGIGVDTYQTPGKSEHDTRQEFITFLIFTQFEWVLVVLSPDIADVLTRQYNVLLCIFLYIHISM